MKKKVTEELVMKDFSRLLGDAVKRARGKQGLTQTQVAEQAHIDVRTVLNIENYKANPKMEKLFPLVRALRVDAREIFNPEMKRESPALQELRLLIEECNESEATTVIPVLQTLLQVLRKKDKTPIE